MNYSEEFKKLVSKSDPNNNNDYIGTGNPNAKILIVGKECAINSEIEKNQLKGEVEENIIKWINNIKNPNTIIENWNGDSNNINPLFPYKGQKFNIYNEKRNSGKGGTSSTWYYYQKLYNKIKETTQNLHTEINFHDDVFITELNANPSNYSKDQNKEIRKNSIKERSNIFFKSDFIQNFPIVILATSHYTREHNIDICKLFDVDFIGITNLIDENTQQWYNIHINKEKTKLLIHTKQLSMNISDKLLDKIANEIKLFAKENNIKL